MKYTSKLTRTLATALITFGPIAGGARAAVTFVVSQVGDNIVISSTGGSFNLASFTYLDTTFLPSGAARIKLSQSGDTFDDAIYVGSGFTDLYGGTIQGPQLGPTVSVNAFSVTTTGSWYGIYQGANRIFVPQGYVSGDALPNSSATYSNVNLAEWGLANGDHYTWNWGVGGNADSATLTVIPEPSSAILFGLAGLGLAIRRRKK